MRQNYKAMCEFLKSKNLFKKGEIMNKRTLRDKLQKLHLEEEFHNLYSMGFQQPLCNRVYDSYNSFTRFVQQCEKMGYGYFSSPKLLVGVTEKEYLNIVFN